MSRDHFDHGYADVRPRFMLGATQALIDTKDEGLIDAVAAEIAAQEGTKWETLRARGSYRQNAKDLLEVIRTHKPAVGT